MKLNATPRHYMPLSQNQSDEDESGPVKEEKGSKLTFKSSFDASTGLSKTTVQAQVVKVNIKALPMSPIRKLVFIISLIMCVLFVVIFVFCIPCSMSDNLSKTFHLTYKWKRIFHNMTFSSPSEFVNSNNSGTPLIILGCINSDSSLIAIQENNGKERWKLHFHSTPLSSICNILDLNLDGIPECLIIGNKGLFAAVDVEKGTTLWYLHNHSDILNAHSVYGPTIVPDCDDDGIMDIIISYYLDKEDKSSYLAFVSGSTGQIIGSLLDLPECKGPITQQFAWKSQNESHIILYCAENGNGNLWLLSSKEACEFAFKVINKLPLTNIFRVPPFAKDIHIYKLSTSEDQLVIVLDGVKFLLLEKSYKTFQLKWKAYVEGEQHMKVLTDGHFNKKSNLLIITSVNTSTSKIMGIDLKDGKVVSIAQVNGSVKAGVKLPNYFTELDGLILKIVRPEHLHGTKKPYEILRSNVSDNNQNDDFDRAELKNYTAVFEESYVLLKCGQIPIFEKVHSEKVLTSCKGGDCYPNTYIKDSTVLVKKAEHNFSFDVMTVTSTMLPSSGAVEEMIVNFLNLENISTLSACSS